jgi:pre-mRNA-processing factor 6
MRAKDLWLNGNVDGARRVLSEAFLANPNSEEIWLAAFKLENENNEIERAKLLLEKAREKADTARVWMKSIVFERQQRNYENCFKLIERALEKYPKFEKLWMISVQLEEQKGDANAVRECYDKAVRKVYKVLY